MGCLPGNVTRSETRNAKGKQQGSPVQAGQHAGGSVAEVHPASNLFKSAA